MNGLKETVVRKIFIH